MAGRPASSGTTGIMVGLVVAVIVSVISVGLLIWLWTKQEELRAETERAKDDVRQLMSSSERQSAYRGWIDKATGSTSVAGLMGAELNQFSELVTGDQTPVLPGTVETLRSGAIDALWGRISEDPTIEDPNQIIDRPLVAALEALFALYTSEHSRYTQAQAELQELTRQVESLAAERRTNEEQFESKATELAAQVSDIENNRQAFSEAKEEQFREMEQNVIARGETQRMERQALQGELEEQRTRLVKAEESRRQMQDKLREFQTLPKSGGSARLADAQVISATPGSEAVFIDLGRADNLILGMRFAVYSAQWLPGHGQAKAAVEVINIGDAVTECRTVWDQEMNPIIRGDVVANPIYDRTRQLVFMVIGEFDFDYDGVDDPNGSQTVEAVIKDFNGAITEELGARVDFLVVGARPPTPRLPREPEEAAVIKLDYEDRVAAYTRTLEDAKALSIPMLTQSVFLNFLGRR